MLYGVSPSDTATLAGVVLIVLGVTMIGSLLPAIRASRLQPMQVLRDEKRCDAGDPRGTGVH